MKAMKNSCYPSVITAYGRNFTEEVHFICGK